jgi:hypothetical protein
MWRRMTASTGSALLLSSALLVAAAAAATNTVVVPRLLRGNNVVFVGRVQQDTDSTTKFDMNGVEIRATVTGTTGLSISLSQVEKVEGNTFQVYLDGVLQPHSRFNTSTWGAGQVIKVLLFPRGSLGAAQAHAVSIFKDTEPSFATTAVKMPNYITFHGFSGDDSSAQLLPPPVQSLPKHKVEFLGDSITAGFDNQCDIPGSPKGFPWSESFAKSWAPLMCSELGAECHYNAWSGFGMVANCCGGSTLASDVWTRTLATVGSTNASDPHGTVASNVWDFRKWRADAVVVNLGTNDHLGRNQSAPKSQAYQSRYLELVVTAAKVYGKETGFFLACGPMSTDYCPEVEWVIASAKTAGIKAFLLNQSSFEDGAYGKKCAVSVTTASVVPCAVSREPKIAICLFN